MMTRLVGIVVLLVTWCAFSSVAAAATTRVCYRYPGSEFPDASPQEFVEDCTSNADCDSIPGITGACNSTNRCTYDFGEDLGMSTGSWKVRRAFTIVYNDNGTVAFLGHVNSSGCTPPIDTSGAPFDTLVFPLYENPNTKFRFEVQNCTGSSCYLPQCGTCQRK